MSSEDQEIESNICKSLKMKVAESQMVSKKGHFME